MTKYIDQTPLQVEAYKLFETLDDLYSKLDEQIIIPVEGAKRPDSKQALIRPMILEHFREEEFIELVTTLGLDYDAIPSRSYSEKVLETLVYFGLRRDGQKVVEACFEQKPSVDWYNARLGGNQTQITASMLAELSSQEQIALLLCHYFLSEEIVGIVTNLDEEFEHLATSYRLLIDKLCAVVVTYAFNTGQAEALLAQMKAERPLIETIQKLLLPIINDDLATDVDIEALFAVFAEPQAEIPPPYLHFANLLDTHFSMIDLEEMFIDSGLWSDNFGRGTKSSLIRAFILRIMSKALHKASNFIAICRLKKPEVDWAAAAHIEESLIPKPENIVRDPTFFTGSYKTRSIRQLLLSICGETDDLLALSELTHRGMRSRLSVTMTLRENALILLETLLRLNKMGDFLTEIEARYPAQYKKFEPYEQTS